MALPPLVVVFIIECLWGVGICYWVARGFSNKRSVYRQSRRSVWLYLLVASAYMEIVFNIRALRAHALRQTLTTQIGGIALCVMGIALAVAARRTLGRNWSGLVTLKQDHELIRHGPYRFVRHPIYAGVIVAVAGTLLAIMPDLRGLLVFVFLATALRLKSIWEEKMLSRQFPEEYPRYMRQVKALVPFVY